MLFFFFFNDTATTEIYTLSLHDALPIYFNKDDFAGATDAMRDIADCSDAGCLHVNVQRRQELRSEEHTSELQSRQYLVCRLLLEKKNKQIQLTTIRATDLHN